MPHGIKTPKLSKAVLGPFCVLTERGASGRDVGALDASLPLSGLFLLEENERLS